MQRIVPRVIVATDITSPFTTHVPHVAVQAKSIVATTSSGAIDGQSHARPP